MSYPLPEHLVHMMPWLKEVNLETFLVHWQLQPISYLGGGMSSLVLLCEDNLILKLLPDQRSASIERSLLQLWHEVACPIRGQYKQALLLEKIDGVPLVRLPWENHIHQAVANLSQEMHLDAKACQNRCPVLPTLSSVKDARLATLGGRVTNMPEFTNAYKQMQEHIKHLLASTPKKWNVTLHGDFQPNNLLWDETTKKLWVIDPKGAWGDKHYDLSQWIMAGVPEGFEDRLDVFCEIFPETDRTRLIRWLYYLALDGWISAKWRHADNTQAWERAYHSLNNLVGELDA